MKKMSKHRRERLERREAERMVRALYDSDPSMFFPEDYAVDVAEITAEGYEKSVDGQPPEKWLPPGGGQVHFEAVDLRGPNGWERWLRPKRWNG